MSDEMKLTEQEEMFLEYMDQGLTIIAIAEHMEISKHRGYQLSRKLKDVILERQRDKLAFATSKAVDTLVNSLDADASTEKGELKVKAAESILNRTGLTSHTSVEVQVESENGIFILPAKQPVASDEENEG